MGTVSFYNGTTLLNTTPATVTAGQALMTTNALPLGQLNLTAVYNSNLDFVTSTSSPIDVNNTSPDFSITASPVTQTVIPTQSVSYTLTLTPQNPTFAYPVSLSVSGLPSGVSAVYSPASISAGASTSQVTLTLSADSSAKLGREPLGPLYLPPQTALALLPMAFLLNRRFRKRCAKLSGKLMLFVLLALAMAGAITVCGGGGFFAHKTVNYTVTVTAISGPNTHTATVNLTVK